MSEESSRRFIAITKDDSKFDDNVELRKVFLDFIADFANWDNSTAPQYLKTSRTLTQTAHEALGGEPGEETPPGLILCAGKASEQIELLELDKSGIKVAEYMAELLKRELLEQKLHKAVELARKRLGASSDVQDGDIINFRFSLWCSIRKN